MRRNYRSLVGVLAEDSLRQLKSDIAFLGTSGVDDELVGGTRRWSRCRSSGDDRRRRPRRADRRRRQVLDDRRGARVRAGRSTPSSPTRRCRRAARSPRRARRDRGDARMKLTIVGGGGFRVPLVYGALLRERERLGLEEVVLHDIDAARLERIGRVLDGLAAEHGERLPFRATTDLVDARRGRRLRLLRDPRRPARGPRGRRGRPARARRARAGDDRAGRHLLRAAHDPGDGARSPRRSPSTRRGAWLINFTNPAGMVTEAVQQVLGDRAVGICDSPSGLCRRVAAALGRDAERAVVRLLRPQPPRLAARRARRAAATCCPGLLEDDERARPASRRGGCSAASGCARSG